MAYDEREHEREEDGPRVTISRHDDGSSTLMGVSRMWHMTRVDEELALAVDVVDGTERYVIGVSGMIALMLE